MFYHQCDNDKTRFKNIKLSIKIYWSILEILCIKFYCFPMEDFENKTQISINKITILKLENSRFAKHFLLFITLLGTSTLIGDGILTPCVSNIWLAKLIIFILEVHYITFILSLSATFSSASFISCGRHKKSNIHNHKWYFYSTW